MVLQILDSLSGLSSFTDSSFFSSSFWILCLLSGLLVVFLDKISPFRMICLLSSLLGLLQRKSVDERRRRLKGWQYIKGLSSVNCCVPRKKESCTPAPLHACTHEYLNLQILCTLLEACSQHSQMYQVLTLLLPSLQTH